MLETLSTPLEQDHGQDQLRRRLYLWALVLIVPAALATVAAAFPEPGAMRSISLLVISGWIITYFLLLWRKISLRSAEWSVYLLGVTVFLVTLIFDLWNLPQAQPLAFVGAANLLYAWAFLTFGVDRGLKLSVAFYAASLLLGAIKYIPLLLNGQFIHSHLTHVWQVHVYFYALGPVYIALTAAMAIIIRDQAKRRLQVLTEYAYVDALTGLPNRRAFQEHLDSAVKYAVEHQTHGALALLNITDFTRINDELGHAAGDQILRALAERWQPLIQSGTHLSRVSGDEFALIIPSNEWPVVEPQIRQLIDSARQPIHVKGTTRGVHFRVGVVCYPKHGQDGTSVTVAANVAQDTARTQNPPLMVYNTALAATVERRRRILTELERPPEQLQFRLEYQPIYHLQTGELQAAEALIRWDAPLEPKPTPDEFISLAEEARLIRPIGHWVMHTALQQMRIWQENGTQVPRINVNVSPQELLHEHYAEHLLRTLHTLQLKPSILELELTKRTVLEPDALTQLRTLREAGVQVAIDDFGTGQSSLAWLHNLPITAVKLDRRFTRMLGQDGAADRLSRTVLNLASSLNLEVVAEGIETHEQMKYLRDLNCPLGQGYLFSKPLPPQQLEAFLAGELTLDQTTQPSVSSTQH